MPSRHRGMPGNKTGGMPGSKLAMFMVKLNDADGKPISGASVMMMRKKV